jgi:glycosyltransferase involved in cell wall biosynthesis
MLHFTYRLQQAFNRIMELIGLVDHIVVVCKWLQEMLERNGVDQRKIVLSRHGLPAHYLTGYPEDQRSDTVIRIGYLGRFAPLKGVDVLVEAFRKLPRDIPIELHLWGVLGNMACLNGIKQQIEADPRIHYFGPLTDEHRHDVLSTWHAMAVPSLSWETGPLVVLEAFAAGVPVLGSNLGGIAELVEHRKSGLLISSGDVAAWKLVLMEFYQLTLSGHLWQFPAVRPSREVAIDMSRLYKAALSAQDSHDLVKEGTLGQ